MAAVDHTSPRIQPHNDLSDSGISQQLLDPLMDYPSTLATEPGNHVYVDPGPRPAREVEVIPPSAWVDPAPAERSEYPDAKDVDGWVAFVKEHSFEDIDRAINEGRIDRSVFSNGDFDYQLRQKVQAHEHYFELLTMMSQVNDRIAQTIIRAIA